MVAFNLKFTNTVHISMKFLFRVLDSGFSGLGYEVWGLGRVVGVSGRDYGLGFRVQGLGLQRACMNPNLNQNQLPPKSVAQA